MEQEVLIVSAGYSGWRLDRYLTEQFDEYSRSALSKLVENGSVLLDGRPVKKNGSKIKEGNTVSVILPEPEPVDIIPENIPLEILYEDSDVILVNKPKGMVVHPAAGHYSQTLVNALIALYYQHPQSYTLT